MKKIIMSKNAVKGMLLIGIFVFSVMVNAEKLAREYNFNSYSIKFDKNWGFDISINREKIFYKCGFSFLSPRWINQEKTPIVNIVDEKLITVNNNKILTISGVATGKQLIVKMGFKQRIEMQKNKIIIDYTLTDLTDSMSRLRSSNRWVSLYFNPDIFTNQHFIYIGKHGQGKGVIPGSDNEEKCIFRRAFRVTFQTKKGGKISVSTIKDFNWFYFLKHQKRLWMRLCAPPQKEMKFHMEISFGDDSISSENSSPGKDDAVKDYSAVRRIPAYTAKQLPLKFHIISKDTFNTSVKKQIVSEKTSITGDTLPGRTREKPFTLENVEKKINIIPTPKQISISDKIFLLNQKNENKALVVTGIKIHPMTGIGVKEINKKFNSISGKNLIIKSEKELTELDFKKQNLILIGTVKENSLIEKYFSTYGIKIPQSEQGYIIKFINENNRSVVILSGNDFNGTLYACITFCYLIKSNGHKIYTLEADIKDWPDFKYRYSGAKLIKAYRTAFGMHGAPDLKKGTQMAEKLINWLLQHKINIIGSPGRAVPGTADLYYDDAQRKWLREIHDYAIARGIFPIYVFHGDAGYYREDGKYYKRDRKLCKGMGVLTTKGRSYYCWSRDNLIRKRFGDIARLVKDTHIKIVGFHLLDNYNEGWERRSEYCRKRFGKDRAKAQANIINIFYEEIKKLSPNTMIMIIPRPYEAINMNWEANRWLKKRFERLSGLIPKDIYIVHTAGTREAVNSWRITFQRPLCHWVNLGERYFDPQSGLVKTYYFDNNDIYFQNIYHVAFNPVQMLAGVEFSWNTDAPGSVILKIDKKNPYQIVPNLEDFDKPEERGKTDCAKDNWAVKGKPYSEFSWQWQEPGISNFIFHACLDLYGEKVAPYMTKVFLSNYTPGFIANPREYEMWYHSDIMYDQYKRAREAAIALDTILEKELKFKEKEQYEYYLNLLLTFHKAKIEAKARYHLIKAEELIKEDNIEGAERDLSSGYKELTKGKEELENLFARITKKFAGRKRRFSPEKLTKIEDGWKQIAKELDLLKIAISMKKIGNGKSACLHIPVLGEGHYKEGNIKVAIYYPNETEGKVLGWKGIYNTLKMQEDMDVTLISDLRLETLDKYDCLIFPDTKKLGNKDKDCIKAIREYVLRKGGGVYFQHDSVGFRRFPLRGSIFPEVCGGAPERVEDTQLTLVSQHPILPHYKLGDNVKHMYYDHIALNKDSDGEFILVDRYNNPVVIAGCVGKGRVVFDGTIIYLSKGEAQKATGVNKDLLINSVYWIVGKKQEDILVEITNKRKENIVTPKAVSTFIIFNLKIISKKPLKNVSVVTKVFDSADNQLLKKKLTSVPSQIDKFWQREFKLNLMGIYEKVKMEIVLHSGGEQIIKNILFFNIKAKIKN